jgi:hypothetical protein
MDVRTENEQHTCGPTGADTDGNPEVVGDVAARLEVLMREIEQKVESGPSRPKEDPRLKRPLSKRSGGPRTESGIAAASKNSLTHGAYATRLPDHPDFSTLAKEARVEFRPCGLIERTIVWSLAHEAYKSQRLDEMERCGMRGASERVADTQALARMLEFPWAQTHAELLLEPVNEQLLQRELYVAWRELAAPPTGAEPGQVVSVPDQRVLELYGQGCELLGSMGLVPFMHEGFFMRLDVVMHEARGQQSYLGRRIAQGSGEMMLVQYWLYRNASRVTAYVRQVLHEQVLEVLVDERLARARSYVNANIHRGVSSLVSVKSVKGMDRDTLWSEPVTKPPKAIKAIKARPGPC